MNDLRIVLIDGKYLTFHSYHISWTHLYLREIYTNTKHDKGLVIPLDNRYSYAIQSTDWHQPVDLTPLNLKT